MLEKTILSPYKSYKLELNSFFYLHFECRINCAKTKTKNNTVKLWMIIPLQRWALKAMVQGKKLLHIEFCNMVNKNTFAFKI